MPCPIPCVGLQVSIPAVARVTDTGEAAGGVGAVGIDITVVSVGQTLINLINIYKNSELFPHKYVYSPTIIIFNCDDGDAIS